ncbi:MAG: trigger factor [Chloroflexi bacterium]|nr:trigger factor [Chloroflexota bacterium]
MKVTSEKTGPCEYTLTIEVDEERTKKALQSTARTMTRRAPIPGFRPGKAPYSVIEAYFGKEVVYGRTIEALGPEVYKEALDEAKLEPYSQGNLDMATMEPLVLKAVVPVEPVVTLGDYHSIKKDKAEVPFDEAEIDKTIEELREQHAEWSAVERAVQEGDQVTIDLVGRVGEEEVLSQAGRRTEAIPTMFPEGLFDHVVGVEPGQSVDYEQSYPEDHFNSKLAGKTVSYHLTVQSVREKELPQVTDEFANTVGSYENLAALRDGIREKLYTSKQEDADEALATEILAAILEDATMEYPQVAVDDEVERHLREFKQRIQSQGFSWESYLNTQKKTEDELRDEVRPSAEQHLRENIVLAEIAKKEGIKVEAGAVEAEIVKMLEPYGAQAQMLRPYIDNEVSRQGIERRLLTTQTVKWLIAMATGQPWAEAAADQPPAEVEAAEDAAAA